VRYGGFKNYWINYQLLDLQHKIQYVSAKKNFVLRMDEEMYKALEKWAADEFRSVNGQIECILDKALKETGRSKNAAKAAKKNDKNTS